jgi:hypothetical protein
MMEAVRKSHPVKLGFVSKPQLKPRKRKKVEEA